MIALTRRLVALALAFVLVGLAAPYTATGLALSSIYEVKFVDANSGQMVGRMDDGTGFLARSTNGGANWSYAYNPSMIVGLGTFGATTSWAVGWFQNSALHSSTSGSTWQTKAIPATGLDSSDIEALSNTTAVAVGVHNGTTFGSVASIWRTVDSGSTWTEVYEGPHYWDSEGNPASTLADLEGSDFAPDNVTGWAVGTEWNPATNPMTVMRVLVFKTANGGATWSLQSAPGLNNVNDVYAVSPTVAWLGGGGRNVSRTTDGGTSWVARTLPNITFTASTEIFGVWAKDANTCVAVGSGGQIAKTTDGGATWTKKTSGTTQRLRSVTFVGDVGWAAGDGGVIIKSTDGGETWGPITVTPPPPPATDTVTAFIDSVTPNPVAYGAPVTFTGHGVDSLGHGVSQYEWKDGGTIISSASSFTKSNLSAGSHTIALRVKCASGTWSAPVTKTLTVGAAPPPGYLPVYRFYNTKAGVHFYTASAAEKDDVIAKLSATYKFEGTSYQINTANPDNKVPLYRFYNVKTGVHFYTANEAEKNSVIKNLATTYKYEGVAYSVSQTPTNAAPVYRFYNLKQGVHFYTASAAEKDSVIKNLATTYKYEGVGYYIGQ